MNSEKMTPHELFDFFLDLGGKSDEDLWEAYMRTASSPDIHGEEAYWIRIQCAARWARRVEKRIMRRSRKGKKQRP